LSERTARNSAIQASGRIPILHLLCWCCAERPVRSADDVHEARRVASSLASDRMGRRAARPYGACGGTCGTDYAGRIPVSIRKAAQATLPGRCGLTGAGRDEWIAWRPTPGCQTGVLPGTFLLDVAVRSAVSTALVRPRWSYLTGTGLRRCAHGRHLLLSEAGSTRSAWRHAMRIFSATIATESNMFSPMPTSLAGFKESVFLRPGEHPDDAPRMCTAPLWVARRRAAAEGFTLVEGSCFAASPAGTTVRRTTSTCATRSRTGAARDAPGRRAARPPRGDGRRRVRRRRGDVIERVRDIVGPTCVIGVELDLHCHLTVKRVRLRTSSSSTRSFRTPTWPSGRRSSSHSSSGHSRRGQASHVALRLPTDR